jgi:hypothetical protein
MKRARRGRPKKADAKRRATTRAARAPRIDRGTDELQWLRLVLNGRPDLSADPLSWLLAHDRIDRRCYDAGRRYQALTETVWRAWGLQQGSVADLYRRMGAGTIADIGTSTPTGNGGIGSADVARAVLDAMNAELWPRGDSGAGFYLVRAVVVEGAWPAWLRRIVVRTIEPRDAARLDQLVDALGRLAGPPRSVIPHAGKIPVAAQFA